MEKRTPSVSARVRNPFLGSAPNTTLKTQLPSPGATALTKTSFKQTSNINNSDSQASQIPSRIQRDFKQMSQTPPPSSSVSAQVRSFDQSIDKKQQSESFMSPKEIKQAINNQTMGFSLHNNSKSKVLPGNSTKSEMTSPSLKNFGIGDDLQNELSNKEKDSKTNPRGPHDSLDLIKRRLDALKLLQMKTAISEAKFYEELYLLECKYNKINKPLKDLRRKIIIGDHEPFDDECKLIGIGSNGDHQLGGNKSLNDELEREREISKDLLALSISNYSDKKGDFVKGIPEFWLSVFKRVGLVSQMIEVHDEPVLKYLYDVDVDLHDKKPYNFTLKFYFWPNEFFTDTALTKTYEFKIELDSTDPYVFEAPETECSKGCKINWKKGKNVTRKLAFNSTETGESKQSFDFQDRQPSFFNFFDTIDIENKNRNCLTCDEEAELAIDYEIGYTFKEKVVPRAILYYMGEISDENDQSDFEEYDDENDEDEEAQFNENSEFKTEMATSRNLNKN